MLANRDYERPARIRVALRGFEPGDAGEVLMVSRREYMWLDRNHDAPAWEKPRSVEWDNGFGVRKASVKAGSVTVDLPPASLAVLRLPRAPENRRSASPEATPQAGGKLTDIGTPVAAAKPATKPRLEIWVPAATAYADTPVEGWVLAYNGTDRAPCPKPLADGTLTVTGPAKADRKTVRLAEAAGRFLVTASKPGKVWLEARADGRVARATINFVTSIPRPTVFWEFEEEGGKDMPFGVRSQWKLTSDPGIRPNQRVLRIEPEGDNPAASKKRELVMIDRFPGPDKLNRGNIRGAFFDIKTGEDFRCDDPNAQVELVLQGNKNWWMWLGTAPLKDIKEWKTVTFPLDKPEHVKAVDSAGSFWIILSADKPVYGSIYIDRAGFLVR
jgi:hypothetical protein